MHLLFFFGFVENNGVISISCLHMQKRFALFCFFSLCFQLKQAIKK